MTGKLDGGGGWLREKERETEIRERSENIFILFYFILF